MLIRKRKIIGLSSDIRKIIDGQKIDLRENREGAWGILKNDIHTLATSKSAQADSFEKQRDIMRDTLANISHQLKTPLTSIMIMADILEQSSTDQQLEFIANIKAGLTRMEWLVTSLLKMAKLDAGAVDFTTGSISARELIDLALEPLQILLDIKNQSVAITSELELCCDKRWTAEALTNVINNASEYTPSGGTIYIEAGENPICQWISVTDSGTGISKHKISNLFKRFEGSKNDRGYGIGLPLALAIFQGQNGDIAVDGGGNGRGATLTLKFFK